MKPRDLSKRQRQILADQCGDLLAYLNKLTKRLDRVGMDPTSDLYRSAHAAYNAVHGLRVTTMYLAMDQAIEDFSIPANKSPDAPPLPPPAAAPP